ncbi:MAG TPA: DUF805 domain-containing protein [Gemmatimonadaceae bacterium]|nr:DUF805 domain-containing protein [Gemmatimonadaceae bacterium]
MGGRLQLGLRKLFSLQGRVSRSDYLTTGFALMAFKYVVDATVIYLATRVVWTPADYLFPLLGQRHAKVDAFPTWLQFALLLWTLPFIWIGVTMTLRRAVDAGKSAAWCAAFFVPGLNYAVMLWFAALPSTSREIPSLPVPDASSQSDKYKAAVFGALGAATFSLLAILVSVYGFTQYGGPLFIGAPFLQGLVCGWSFNSERVRTEGETTAAVWISLFIVGGVVFLFAMEGVICLIMALPIAGMLAMMGGYVGRSIAIRGARASGIAAMLFIVPGGSLVDRVTSSDPPVYEVVTAVDVDAPAETVWEHVVAFDEIRAPLQWYFRAGISYPLRAEIAGSGVGAVRRCEFSTGAFVEPITVWNAPKTLAFDVISQPAPLTELSIYSKVYAPHIDGFFQSRRGEFRLTPLAGGRTRLEGHTWYSVSLYPQGYWRAISEPVLHAIHQRVLDQVKLEAEKGWRGGF